MRFNMGCGRNKRPGFVNVDAVAACEPDELWDLEQTPWPWPDNSAEEVVFNHSLEHMGGDPKVFLLLMGELYRICAPEAQVRIAVPHPRHDNFIGDPTHVRPITHEMLLLFDRRLNEEWIAKGGANTPLAIYTGTDFMIERYEIVLDQPWAGQVERGELSNDAIQTMIRTQFNIVRELGFLLRVRKA